MRTTTHHSGRTHSGGTSAAASAPPGSPPTPRQRQRNAEQRQRQIEQRHGAVTPASDDETLVEVRAVRGKDGFAAALARDEGKSRVEDKGAEHRHAAVIR